MRTRSLLLALVFALAGCQTSGELGSSVVAPAPPPAAEPAFEDDGDIDFDYPSELTRNRSNFTDPMHLSDEANRWLVEELATGERRFGR